MPDEITAYRNVGAPFHRANGSEVATDQVFVPTANELRLWGWKLKQADTGAAAPKPEREPVVAGATLQPRAEAKPVAVPDPRWRLAMTPERYLQLHPEGQHAELAREIAAESAADAARKLAAEVRANEA